MSTRILLADSDAILQQTLASRMTAEQIQTVCAGDGNAALCLLNETIPDLLIAEIALPDKNGYSLCRYAREEPEFQSMPVVLLDSHFDASNQSLAYKSGADMYMSKPLEPSELIKVVRSLLESKKAHNDGPVLAGFADTRQQVFAQESHASEGTNFAQKADQLLMPRRSSEGKMIPASLPEMSPSHPRKRRYLLFCFIAAAAILVAIGLAILRRTHTSNIPTIQQESSVIVPSPNNAVALEGQRAELTPRKEMPFASSEATSPSEGEDAPNAVRQSAVASAGAKATQTPPPASSKEQTAASHAETIRPAPKQDSPLVSERKDSTAANNVPAYTPVTRPRSVRSTRSTTIGGHLKRSGHEMKEAGGHFVSGVEHFGKSSGKSVSWAGKKVGSGVRRMGSAIRKIF